MHLLIKFIPFNATVHKYTMKNFFSLSKYFFKDEIYLNHFLSKKYMHFNKRYFSEQIIINSIRKAKNKLDRSSLYLLQEEINNNCKFLNEEKKAKYEKVINELNDLLIDKSYLIEEKTKILNQKNSKKYKNKELFGLFLAGFFFAIGSVTHSIFYLASIYGLYILKKASKENDSKIYMEIKLNDNKNKLIINKKKIEDLLNVLEDEFQKLK
ncbi:conserved Plasmodium protein, unknown function [Plasmodium relictum]|uniref:Uncharacterized protein n=1 Tax=Plasmodium relictum TaxID=85471 RepID=A0A1J1H724_PLARL|nr:conserved Plasmodium protein, unknown function [Plasmodium relictum]CRG99230.1 conserved Plasmodium protein, unknown function [Plasmodium relictum]